ncbi:MAG: ComEC/Rec2 family competence protein [Nocardioides sp.]|nr:ComEC/Rec2 family competence protein [Nocardioides sp.]
MPRPDETVPAGTADLRTPLLGAVAWGGALCGLLLPTWGVGALAVVVGVGALLVAFARGRRWRRHPRGREPGRQRPSAVPAVLAACLVVGLGVGAVAHLRALAVDGSAVGSLAQERATVTVTGLVTTDPRPREGKFADYQTLRLQVRSVTGRGASSSTRVPVVVIADADWPLVELGSVVRVRGRLAPANGEVAALLSASADPEVVSTPGAVLDGAAAVRQALRDSVAHLPPEERALVPALVVGDEQGMPADLVEDFQVSGLTHLLAVSGTNLTLMVGFLLVVARWVGVRGRGMFWVGVLGVVGFVLLARTESSVVRAAAMGTVGLLAMGSNGRQRGTRGLGVAVVGLLLVDPWLATTVGFGLSVAATSGILFLAPVWRDGLARWMPRWLAEAVAVPLAAQIACTPLVAAISGQVSLVAVVANIVAAPAVGPATVAGLAGGLVGVVWAGAARLPGTLAGGCGWWIVTVAERSGDLLLPAVDWSVSPPSLALLTAACVLLAAGLAPVLRRRWSALLAATVMLAGITVPLPTAGAPADWLVVACDVGQGDATLLRAGPSAAVVVDVGPDPDLLRRCLRRFGVRSVPAVVITHFHADHVGGLDGLLGAVPVGEVWTSPLPEPRPAAEAAAAAAAEHGVPLGEALLGSVRRVGAVTWQVVGPRRLVAGGAGGEGGGANNASIVQVADVAGVRVLLTGDIEPEAQVLLTRDLPVLEVDVLKVPHHGSAYQDEGFLTSTGARVALVSAGVDNDYGHPADGTITDLEASGARVLRTDEQGDLVVRGRHDDWSAEGSR